MNILELLPEVLDHIFSFCHKSQVLNFACCCKLSYESVKHIIWRKLKIPWTALDPSTMKCYQKTRLDQETLDNLKYSVSLHFYASDFNYLKVQTFSSLFPRYVYIISHCNPRKITQLTLDGIVDDAGLKVTSQTLTCLRELSISYCSHITEVGMGYLKTLRLVSVSIANCRIQDSAIQKLSDVTTLRVLVVNNCPLLTSSGLLHLCKLNLTKLLISNAKRMHITGVNNIENLKLLQQLSFCRANVTDSTFTRLHSSLPLLEDLKLTGCKSISDEAIHSICCIQSLKQLSIISCIGITNTAMRNICTRLTELEKLSVCGNFSINDEGFRDIAKLRTLHSLDCSWTGMSDQTMSFISSLTTLRHLNISGCKITDKGLLDLMVLKSLRVLLVTHCETINGIGLHHLGMLSSLNELDIRYCVNVDDEVLSGLFAMKWKKLRTM